MKIVDCVQGSPEWLSARAGVLTASECGQLMTSSFEPRKGEMPKTLLALKLAERWIQGPLNGAFSGAMEQGQMLEQDAIPWLELTKGWDIQRVGLLLSDDGRCGASPDGLRRYETLHAKPPQKLIQTFNEHFEGVEIKSPQPAQHVKTLLAGEVPDEHLCQIHFSLYVSGFETWHFCSYSQQLPKFIRAVDRDDGIIAKIDETVQEFLKAYDKAFARLCEINGGPPKPKPAPKKPDEYAAQGLWPNSRMERVE